MQIEFGLESPGSSGRDDREKITSLALTISRLLLYHERRTQNVFVYASCSLSK